MNFGCKREPIVDWAMTRKELVDRLHDQTGGSLSRARLAEVVDHVFDHIADALVQEGRFSQPGFGTFAVTVRSSHPGRNPRTGETIQVPESSTVRFKPAEKLRGRLNH
jgi:nucleoid DNA-binding protein